MLDLEDYTTLWDHTVAWTVYLGAAAIFLVAYLRLTRRWWFEARWLSFALLAAFVLVPAPVPGRALLAPALIFIALSPFTGSPELIASVIVRLLLAASAAFIFTLLVAVIRRLRSRA